MHLGSDSQPRILLRSSSPGYSVKLLAKDKSILKAQLLRGHSIETSVCYPSGSHNEKHTLHRYPHGSCPRQVSVCRLHRREQGLRSAGARCHWRQAPRDDTLRLLSYRNLVAPAPGKCQLCSSQNERREFCSAVVSSRNSSCFQQVPPRAASGSSPPPLPLLEQL